MYTKMFETFTAVSGKSLDSVDWRERSLASGSAAEVLCNVSEHSSSSEV